MSKHTDHKFSITMHTLDLSAVSAMRGFAEWAQRSGNKRIAWGNTKENDWRLRNEVTFHFTSPEYRDDFINACNRLFQPRYCQEVARSDNDFARRASK